MTCSTLRLGKTAAAMALLLAVAGCKYYGSALPPDYPVSMDTTFSAASDQRGTAAGGQRPVVRQASRPRIERPSYLPEKELALVSPPKTLLVWTYPHITDDNTRVFGNWSTIFLTDRYEWTRPANELGDGEDDAGTTQGRPNVDAGSQGGDMVGNLTPPADEAGSAPSPQMQETPKGVPPKPTADGGASSNNTTKIKTSAGSW